MSEHQPVAPEPQDSESPPSHDSSAASTSGIGAEPLDPWAPGPPRESAAAPLRVPNPAGVMPLRVRYSEGDMRLRVTYPDQGTETPSGLVVRSEYGSTFVLFLLPGAFLALMAWAANGPPPDGDVGAARFMAVIALGLLVAAWRFASERLRATKRGIVISKFATRRRIPWARLRDVTFLTVTDPETHQRLYEQLVLETKQSGAPRSGDLAGVVEVDEVVGDANDPTDSLHFVQTFLLAMRDEYAVPPRARPDIQDS
jgi:hypothetical protein